MELWMLQIIQAVEILECFDVLLWRVIEEIADLFFYVGAFTQVELDIRGKFDFFYFLACNFVKRLKFDSFDIEVNRIHRIAERLIRLSFF